MRITTSFLITALTLNIGVLSTAANAAGRAPEEKFCNDETAVKAADAATQGGCVVINRRKGNCMACHEIAGIASGNVAPPLVAMQQRFPNRARLKAQVEDARTFNPDSVMPPFGPHKILSPEEIEQVLEFLLTL